MSKYYAGIGSRETPLELRPKIHRIVEILNSKGYTLNSGGASGADTFFEEKAVLKQIFLPSKGFNGNSSELYENFLKEAEEMAMKFHPNWNALSWFGKKLMTRNSLQVFGIDMKTPIEFCVCYTTDGKTSGGTGQAMRICKHHNIPVYNLFFEKDYEHLISRITTQSIF